MELFEAIRSRHSYRGPFLKRAVPRDDLSRIVEAGLMAPSGYNSQTTSFVIVDEAELIRAVADIMGKAALREVPALIVVLMDGDGSPGKNFRFGVEDYSAATENLLLAITALGYASVWIDGALRSERRAERIAELLGVPGRLEVRVVLPVGIPAEKWTQQAKKPFDERAWFNRRR
jgi:nitroreductase